MVKKVARRRNHKDPFYLRGVRSNVNTEIGVLMERLDRGTVPKGQIPAIETRVNTLMNQTLPNIERRIKEAEKRQNS